MRAVARRVEVVVVVVVRLPVDDTARLVRMDFRGRVGRCRMELTSLLNNTVVVVVVDKDNVRIQDIPPPMHCDTRLYPLLMTRRLDAVNTTRPRITMGVGTRKM